ncbi:hypothetical protein K1719_018733 [Acacia pycnantha]|nr:hypothetical protein K1719_018733 [Acacia pycnantha]
MNSEYMGRFKLKGVVDVSFTVVVFFCVFFTRSLTASNPLQGDLCKGKFCGEGRCQETQQFPFVECICNPGWSTFQNMTSLPCVLPNCNLGEDCKGVNLGVNEAPPPFGPPPLANSVSPEDACWINGICGPDGRCESDGSGHKCQCSDDAANLLGDPKLPCFNKCLLLFFILSSSFHLNLIVI